MSRNRYRDVDTLRRRIIEGLVITSAVVAMAYALYHLEQGQIARALASVSAMAAAAIVLILLRRFPSTRPAVMAATAYAAAMTLGLLASDSFPASDFVWTLLVPLLIAYAGGLAIARWLLPLYAVAAVAIVLAPSFPRRDLWGELELTVRFVGLLLLVSAMAYLYERNRSRVQERLQREVDERRAAQAELSAASEAKSRFLSQMSHDIRTPLTGVLGMAGLLEGTDLDARQRRYVETILVGGRALTELIGDILDMAKIEAGRIELVTSEFTPADLHDEVLRILAAQAEGKGLRLIGSVDPRLPRQLVADPARLREILLNLGGNAVKFTEAGEIELSMGLRPDEASGWWRLQIRDTGVGIPPERHRQIFESFTQANVDVARRHGGTGLGLAICSLLVDLMGGEIGVESEEGRGSTFWVHLPLVTPGAEWAAPRAAAPPPELGRLRLLVVDDSDIVRRVVTTQLRRLEHTVDEARDGEGALEMLARDRFDAVLMDLQMPGIDGLEATRRLRRGEAGVLDATVPVVAITALADPETRQRCLDAGMAGVVTKPIEMDVLLRALAGATAGRSVSDPDK